MISLLKLYYRIGRDYFSGGRSNPNSKLWVDRREGELRSERTERIFSESCLVQIEPGDSILVEACLGLPVGKMLTFKRARDQKELGTYYVRKD